MNTCIFERIENDPHWNTLWQDAAIDGLAIALEGALGSGKTSLVRHFLRSLGVEGMVKSPTYTLCEYYYPVHRLPVLHIDAYRLTDSDSWHTAGLDLWDNRGVTRWVEWCSVEPQQYKQCDMVIHILPSDYAYKRVYRLSAQSKEGEKLLERIMSLS